ncbi:hypothetical protein [Bradyrhizobium sp. SZCCHNPS2010]|uniref:hypothetical protein n=1 Tax=Bradyrhizobium sp. SZCCHNPS2010 TaxID=3057333 RepID=UPI00291713AE|nr:hypothetical protein [Bradyrhizobium sp. SZCCHNPS2010]
MSSEPIEPTLGAFTICGESTAKVGYRDLATGSVIVSIEIPTQVVERAILANALLEISLSGDGEVACTVDSAGSDCSSRTSTSIDRLVEQLLSDARLYMEETTEAELRTLLQRLRKSARAVERTIALLQGAPKSMLPDI